MIELKIQEKTEIDGLHWGKNYYVQTGRESYTLVANKGPLITDMIYFPDNVFDTFTLQIGQTDRYTFIGDPEQEIVGIFVDCRKDSPTLHKRVILKFKPDPKKHLYIERGIAKRFEGIKNITIRSEPVWYTSQNNPQYNVGNDRIIIPRQAENHEFPVVQINELPLPDEALQVILKREQQILKDKKPFKQSFDALINGEIKRITLKKKE